MKQEIVMNYIVIVFACILLIALNLMWILGINGEVRTTAITFNTAFIALALNKLRVKKRSDSNG